MEADRWAARYTVQDPGQQRQAPKGNPYGQTILRSSREKFFRNRRAWHTFTAPESPPERCAGAAAPSTRRRATLASSDSVEGKYISTPPTAMQSPPSSEAATRVRSPLSRTPLLRFTGYTVHWPRSSRQMAAWHQDTEGVHPASALRIRPTMFSQ